MGVFENHPWLLIPIIILTMEGWIALKALFFRARQRSKIEHKF